MKNIPIVPGGSLTNLLHSSVIGKTSGLDSIDSGKPAINNLQSWETFTASTKSSR